MQTDYNIMSNEYFNSLLSKKKIEKSIDKKLTDNAVMTYYKPMSDVDYIIVINKSILTFKTHEEVNKFWKETTVAPAGTVKYEYKFDPYWLTHHQDLNYSLISYDFFSNCKLNRSEPARVLSENILKDGRVSIIYTQLRHWNRGQDPEKFYLAIGSLVFSHWRIEPLIVLEQAINDGTAIFWRPELAGAMDYVPKYSISDYDDRRHRKYICEDQFVLSYDMPGRAKARVYKRINKTCRYYLRFHNKIYSFSSSSDCELIIKQIQLRNLQTIPRVDDKSDVALLESIALISGRIGRYMTADMRTYFNRSDVLSISKTGSMTGLNAIV